MLGSKSVVGIVIVFVAIILILASQVIRYRSVVVKRNAGYKELTKVPRYKNANYSFRLFRDDSALYKDMTVFIGSSIVERWDFERYFAEMPFVNRGVGDDTSTGIRERFESDVLSLAPKKVVIFICPNDIKYRISAEESRSNLMNMLSRAGRNGIEPLAIISMPVIYETNPSLRYSRPIAELIQMEDELAAACSEAGIPYIHLREYLSEEKDLSSYYLKDGIHLNDKGYEMLTAAVLESLKM